MLRDKSSAKFCGNYDFQSDVASKIMSIPSTTQLGRSCKLSAVCGTAFIHLMCEWKL